MYPQKDDWWAEKTWTGLTRNEVALLAVSGILILSYLLNDWDWIFGRR